LLRITDIQDNDVIWNNVPFTNFDTNKAEQYILQNGDILFARTGATVGKSYLVKDVPLNSIYASYLIRIRTSDEICPKYLKLFFESGYYWQQISEGSVGIGQPNVNGTSLGQLLIPIPPKTEQIRIIEEADSLTELIHPLDIWAVNLSNTIERTKKKILDLAMQGKLVPQDPTDEPAADMLLRINPKAKIITDNPHSWNIPSSWTWCYLGDIFQHNTGKALNSSNKDGIDYEYITTSNVYWGRFVLGDLNKMPFKENEIEKCTVCKGDLLVCEGGDIGRAAIWNLEKNIMIQNHLHRLRPLTNEICTALYFHVFRLYKDRDLIGGKGIALQGFSSKSLHHLIVPLPPSNEQKRIAIQIEELYSTFYEIEASLQS